MYILAYFDNYRGTIVLDETQTNVGREFSLRFRCGLLGFRRDSATLGDHSFDFRVSTAFRGDSAILSDSV